MYNFYAPYSWMKADGARVVSVTIYEGWNFNSGNYLFTTDTK